MPSYRVKDPIDILYIQGKTREFAFEMGFSRREAQELAIVASELTSNILKYGQHGGIELQACAGDHAGCLEIVAFDSGPPFANLDSALKDGWDDQGPIDPIKLLKRDGIGGGLGAVVRFTDAFRVEDRARGKQIITRRYLKPTAVRQSRHPKPTSDRT